MIEAAVGLIVYGVTTEEELQSVADNKEEFKRQLAVERYNVPAAICDLLFEKYVDKSAGKKRAGSGGSDVGSDAKRLCIAQDGKSPAEAFFRVLDQGKEESRFVEFVGKMLGSEFSTNVLFVRDCYKELLKVLLKIVDDPKDRNAVVVMGTPGTGKTVCGLYATFKLLNRNATVLYSLGVDPTGGSGSMYLMGPADSSVLKAAQEQGFNIPKPVGKWVGQVLVEDSVGKKLVRFLENQKELYYVVDPPKSGIMINADSQCKKLVFSSPHRLDENSLKNDSYMRFMPVWT